MKWLVLASLFLARLVPHETDVARVSGGLLQGGAAPRGTHRAYLGIPYATVTNRFQEAEPDPKWEGVKKAHNEHIRCTQRFQKSFISGVEDCLTINVYTPLQTSEQLRPVMVFIHGGGFRDGSGSPYLYGPDFLVKHDVILVSFNYRLEILGFLCLGIKEAPGNVGLKDQVLALKWVQRNIRSFGGDPDNVTIFGESAGAAAVSYHLLSPMSKGLFHRAIMQSGTALSFWAFQFDPILTARKFAQQLSLDTKDLQELVTALRNKTDRELLETRVPRSEGDSVLSENIFVPCVEQEIPGVERFLVDYPYKLLTEGKFHKVPIIIGFNDEEGYHFVGKENDTTIEHLTFLASMPRDLSFPSVQEKKTVADAMKDLYMPGAEISKSTLANYSKFSGDSGITVPTILAIEKILETSDKPVYTYKFTHDGRLNVVKKLAGFKDFPGATHADELFYIFSNKVPVILPKQDQDIIDKMSTMWTNFAKFSDPTPNITETLPHRWRPAVRGDPQVFVIDNTLTEQPLWSDQRLHYWKTVYDKYRRRT